MSIRVGGSTSLTVGALSQANDNCRFCAYFSTSIDAETSHVTVMGCNGTTNRRHGRHVHTKLLGSCEPRVAAAELTSVREVGPKFPDFGGIEVVES